MSDGPSKASEKVNVVFILDGGPTAENCSLDDCKARSVGTFEVVNDCTNRFLFTVNLCDAHAKALGTGYFGTDYST
jgi:hypothetical protein